VAHQSAGRGQPPARGPKMEVPMDTIPLVRPERQVSPRAQRRRRTFFLFISPWLVGFILLTVFPLGFGLFISLTNYDGLNLFNLNCTGVKN